VLPKIIASVIFNPILCLMSMVVGIAGGWIAGISAGVVSSEQYIYGIQYAFIPYYIVYAQIKTIVFAFIITTVSAYQGYFVSGGALEVGRASTKAVVYSDILILFVDLLLTQMLLT
jgi:phospholipid/cholesterol/gamma-HCH transport system permease protein